MPDDNIHFTTREVHALGDIAAHARDAILRDIADKLGPGPGDNETLSLLTFVSALLLGEQTMKTGDPADVVGLVNKIWCHWRWPIRLDLGRAH